MDTSQERKGTMYLGIEIGGTKLQLGVGSGRGGPLEAVERLAVDPAGQAAGIRQRIRDVGGRLVRQHQVKAVGVGFGGPVHAATGRTIRSYQVEGWDDFPLADWCRQTLGLPTVVGNDSDLAGLGEARFGAGRGGKIVFYSNVGSGIGGALVIKGALYRGGRGVASEIGHLRPGPEADLPDRTVESVSSGWAIGAEARRRLSAILSRSPGTGQAGSDKPLPPDAQQAEEAERESAADLLNRCGGNLEQLTGKMVAEALVDGNRLAREVFLRSLRTYGWALAQMITLLAPDVVVIGGGVPQVGEELYLAPLREQVDRYVFPPMRGTFEILPAALGEEVVVHGALALAAGAVTTDVRSG